MALTLEECRKYLPDPNISDEQLLKIRDHLTVIINTVFNQIFAEHKAKAVAGKESKPENPDK